MTNVNTPMNPPVAAGPAPAVRRSPVWAGALLVGGLGLSAAAVASEFVGSGEARGLGAIQLLGLLAGVMAALNGWSLRTPEAWARLGEWWSTPLAARLTDAGRYFAIVGELLLLLLVIKLFEIENQAFTGTVAVLACGGFALHALVPRPYRLSFFVLLSLGGLYAVFGPLDGLWMVGLGLGLIGICHLPVSFRLRVGLLIAAGGALMWLRTGPLDLPWSSAVWPILGSIFMFRLAIYLYDLKHSDERPTVANTLAYFFLLPNTIFPLFPVIDYTTFRQTYYDDEEHEIYQRGVRWMLRGVVQLVAYRFIYHYGTLAPAEVTTPVDLVRYMAANFGLYVRVSGQFHLITGILHLFGFHLPRTNNKYFLASGMTDLWRRINIYWKDFMQKMVFYPAYFRLKRYGEKTALVLGTLLVFAVTWALHGYQWFWLLGEFPISQTDVLFWSILALLMVATTLWEASHGRRRTLKKPKWTLATFVPVALKTVLTFTVMCVLWSVWTSPSIADWFAMIDLRGAP
jgi:D-alanyl-lipoteichoic acid acyltransferase DltB (MBOAT superfamily)